MRSPLLRRPSIRLSRLLLRSLFALCAALSFLSATTNDARSATWGALGDSLTDEYLGDPTGGGIVTVTDLPARNWVQILAQQRGVDFGSFEPAAGTRGEPRNEGFEHNWARSGGTALAPGLLISNIADQAAGLTPAVESGEVSHVYIGAGSNDFLAHLILGRPFEGPVYDAFQQDLIDSLLGTAAALQEAGGAKIIMGLIPPGTALGSNSTIVDAIAGANAELIAQAAGLDITLVDMWAWTSDATRFDASGNLLFAGHTIPLDSAASLDDTVPAGPDESRPCNFAGQCATVAHALNFFAADGLHPNTIVQGLLANEFLSAVNPMLDTPYALLTDQEILTAAIPEPASGLLVAGGLALLAGWRRARR